MRKNLEKLIKIELDWTKSKSCKLTTYAFINQKINFNIVKFDEFLWAKKVLFITKKVDLKS